MSEDVYRPMSGGCARRILNKKVVTPPVLGRPYRAGHKASAAVGTDIDQQLFNACCAERTFIAADASFG
jgi:hypothetical protein